MDLLMIDLRGAEGKKSLSVDLIDLISFTLL